MKTILRTAILVGIVMLSLNYMLGENTFLLLQKIEDPNTGLIYYKVDTFNYLKQIETSFTDYEVLKLNTPPTIEGIEGVVNILSLIANVLLWPIRLGGWMIKNILILLGVNFKYNDTNGLWWLIQFIRVLPSLEIGYIT